jgi:hypothetical protein
MAYNIAQDGMGTVIMPIKYEQSSFDKFRWHSVVGGGVVGHPNLTRRARPVEDPGEDEDHWSGGVGSTLGAQQARP